MNIQKRITEIKKRLARTTRGKWIRRGGMIHPDSLDRPKMIDCLSQNRYNWNANGDFVCNAPDDIRFLITHVHHLNQQVQEFSQRLDQIAQLASTGALNWNKNVARYSKSKSISAIR
jgi:hypothetical protein